MRMSDWSSDVCSSDLAEIIEAAVERGVDGVVELARAGLHEAEQALVDQADFMPARNRLRERVDLLPGDLLGDHAGKQQRGSAAVLGLLRRQQRGGAARPSIALARPGEAVHAGKRAGGPRSLGGQE